MSEHDVLLHLPADTDPHDRCLIAWPSLDDAARWRGHLGAARDAVAELACTIARFEPVTVIVAPGEIPAARVWFGDDVDLVEVDGVDLHLRAIGPNVVLDDTGAPTALCARGNRGQQARRLADTFALPVADFDWGYGGTQVLSDGDLTALVVEPTLVAVAGSRLDAQRELARFGFERVIWLPMGRDDHPGAGQTDGLLAAAGPGRVVLQSTTDASDPDHEAATRARHRLEAAGIEVVVLDVLPHVECFDAQVEVPYVNLYVANGGVIVPVAGARDDHAMLSAIDDAYPGREVVGVPGRVLAYGGVGPRCVTLPLPSPRLR
jgi:agmatine deiminase